MRARSVLIVLAAAIVSAHAEAHRFLRTSSQPLRPTTALQDRQVASDQIPDEWKSLPKVPVGVDGSIDPERIPDSLAFRHFIKATASSASAADIRRRELLLTRAGLSVEDQLAFVNALGEVVQHVDSGRSRRSSAATPRDASTPDQRQAMEDRIFRETVERLRGALTTDGTARLQAHVLGPLRQRIVIYPPVKIGPGARCELGQVSVYVDGAYSEQEGSWTAYSQADSRAADCCDLEYRIELVAATKASTYRTVTHRGNAEITRVYDEPGPVDYKAGLWIHCAGTDDAVAFGSLPATGTAGAMRTIIVDERASAAIDVDSLVRSDLSLVHTTDLAKTTAGRAIVTFETSSEVVLGEPVVIQVTIENRSAQGLSFDLGMDRKANLQFQIRRPDGQVTVLPRWRLGGVGGVTRVGRMRLRPLEALFHQVHLAEWTTLDEPGVYDIRLVIDTIFQTSGGAVLEGPVEQSLRVRVSPRNDERLRQTCDRLARIAVDGSTAQTRLDAAQALTSVGDPVAIPALRRVLATTFADSMVARGLERIGTEDARAVLQEMAASSNAARAAIARGSLSRLDAR